MRLIAFAQAAAAIGHSFWEDMLLAIKGSMLMHT